MKQISIIILAILLLFSCKKDEDTSPPDIQITSPASNTYFSVIDTISISAIIADNEKITNVSVYILNDKAQNISGIKSFSVNTKNYNLNTIIILSDIRLPAGEYDIVVSASDEYNNKKSYRKINLTGINKKLEKIILISQDQDNTYVLEEDLSKSFVQKYTYNGILCDAEINSYYNSLLLLTKQGDLISLNTENYQEFWENNNLNNPLFEYNGSILIYDYLAFVSQKNNSIVAYDYANNIKKTSISEIDNYNSSIFCIHNDFISSCTYTDGVGENKIDKYYYSTGAYQQTTNLYLEPVEILPSFDNSVVIFGNSGQNTSINAFYLEYNALQEIYNFTDENILAACKITDKTFIISTNLNTYLFDASAQSAYILKASYSPQKIFYEETNQLVYCVLNNEVKLFSLPYFQEVNNIYQANDITKVLFKYNY